MKSWQDHFALRFFILFCVITLNASCSREDQEYGAIKLLPDALSKRGEAPSNSADAQRGAEGKKGGPHEPSEALPTELIIGGPEEIGAPKPGEPIHRGVDKRLYSKVFEVSRSQEFLLRMKIKTESSGQEIAQQITMSSKSETQSTQFRQVSNQVESEQFVQGGRGQMIAQELSQNAMGVLDLLVVIDDSGSMAEEQHNLSTKLSPLLSKISSSDWRIGVITTSENTRMRAIINKGDIDAENQFAQAVRAGTLGNSNERGVYQAIRGLSMKGFLREGSSVAVLIVSDEDNHDADPWLAILSRYIQPMNLYKSDQLLSFLADNAKRKLGESARVYGIIHVPNTRCSTAYSEGIDYQKAIQATFGKMGSICDSDYTPTLSAISGDVKSILKSSWQLKSLPAAGSVEVRLNGQPVGADSYSLEGRTLTFKSPPLANAKIEVSYETVETATVSRVKIQKKIVPNSEVITAAGSRLVAGLDYSVVLAADSAEVVFNQDKIPSGDSIINITYEVESQLQSVFTLGVPAEQVAARINGVESQVSFDSTSRSLSFALPPPAGALIDVTYKLMVAKVLTYPLTFGDVEASNLRVVDFDSQSALPSSSYSYADSKITFVEAEFLEGRRLMIVHQSPSFENLNANQYKLPLPEFPQANLTVKNERGEVCGNVSPGQIELSVMPWFLQEDILTLHNQCNWSEGTAFSVGFSYVKIQSDFEMSGLEQDLCNALKWNIELKTKDQVSEVFTHNMERQGCRFVPKPGIALPQESQLIINGSI